MTMSRVIRSGGRRSRATSASGKTHPYGSRAVAVSLMIRSGSSTWLWIAGLALASATGCAKSGDNSDIAGQSVASMDAHVSAEVDRAQTIAGKWVYEGTHRCASNDMARLTIDEVSGHAARGAWYSFNTEREWEGDVIGTLRGDRWYLRFCYAKDKKMGQYTCPVFAPEQVYVQRRGKDLAWYRAQDDAQIAPGQGTPLENGCDRAQREAASRPAPPAATMQPGDKDATRPFVGEWAYVQACGARHSATLRIERVSESRVRGRWDDGTLASSSQGEFIGEARGDRLHLRFCRAYAENDADACPRFGEEQAYVARAGDRLMWYQRDGESRYSEYLSLRFVPPGYEPLQENDCGQAR